MAQCAVNGAASKPCFTHSFVHSRQRRSAQPAKVIKTENERAQRSGVNWKRKLQQKGVR